uniref:CCHC-type domain-containing protein n=1 Tax=Leptobrachium leishanense TaxID=445787 RepID=A0A8C5Q472_9ANUR
MTERLSQDPESVDVASAIRTLTEQVMVIAQSVQQLQVSHATLQTLVHTEGTPAASAPEPPVLLPERFTGERRSYRSFVTSSQVMFSLKPRTFCNEYVKVQTVISLLSGEPQSWAHQLLRTQSPLLNTWETLLSALDAIYDDPFCQDTAQREIKALKQGRRPVEDYVMEFKQYALDTAWNEAALITQFRSELSDQVKDELARIGVPSTLEMLMQASISIDRRFRERRQERNQYLLIQPRRTPQPAAHNIARELVPYTPCSVQEEPMQIGAIDRRLPPEEMARHRTNRLCLYCGQAGHVIRNCPEKTERGRKKMNTPSDLVSKYNSPLIAPHLSIPISLQLNEQRLPLP